MVFKNLFSIVICFLFFNAKSQTDSLNTKSNINISGFLGTYYVYDFNQPGGNQRQNFFFNHNRHNEFNVNLGFIKLYINETKYRANLALQSGTFVVDNYVNENAVIKHIYEANVGLSLNKKNNLWIDAGILPSHIGFESAESIDNLTLTRSLAAEESPYYFGGAKLSYKTNKNLEINALVLNGWQRIQRLQGSSTPSFGTQLKYTNEKTTLNWSTFMGSDFPDSTRKFRYFNNLYAQTSLGKKWEVIVGFDLGMEQKIKNSNSYNTWFSPVVIGRYAFTNQWKAAFRAEYYHDNNQVIIFTNTPYGFKTSGFSINLDYIPAPNLMARIEGRWLNSTHAIFTYNNTPTNNNYFISSSLSIKFN